MANEYLVNSSDLTAVADAIRAKGGTTEALAFPVGFVEAVEAMQEGGGGNVSLPYEGKSYGLGLYNLFDAMSKGNAVCGNFTLASPLPSGSNLIFDTGLSFVRGFVLFDEDEDAGNPVDSCGCVNAIAFFADGVQSNVSSSLGSSWDSGKLHAYGGTSWPFTRINSAAIENGALYVTPTFPGNASYTPFRANRKYVWLAWGDQS